MAANRTESEPSTVSAYRSDDTIRKAIRRIAKAKKAATGQRWTQSDVVRHAILELEKTVCV